MIRFTGETHNFNFRVVGIALNNGRVLLHRGDHEDFWTLPGGRAELGESAADSLKREMQEELKVEVQVERLVWVVENFYRYLDRDWHELAFYFLMTFPEGSELLAYEETFYGYEAFYESKPYIKLIFEWHDLDELENIYLLPSFLKKRLQALPEHVVHVVHIDEPIL